MDPAFLKLLTLKGLDSKTVYDKEVKKFKKQAKKQLKDRGYKKYLNHLFEVFYYAIQLCREMGQEEVILNTRTYQMQHYPEVKIEEEDLIIIYQSAQEFLEYTR